jgi:dethiobiotin synthetase
MSYFITGTDTGVGKTYITCLLLRALNAAGRSALGFKPIGCGDRHDAEALRAAGADPTVPLDLINPVWFRSPVSPMAASMIEHRPVDRAAISAGFPQLARRAEIVLVEGAGGWEVPVQPGFAMADLAAEFSLPVIVVVDNKLGALNHTILTAKAIAARGLRCHGLILNHLSDTRHHASISNRLLLEQLLDLPILAEILHGEETLDPQIAARL